MKAEKTLTRIVKMATRECVRQGATCLSDVTHLLGGYEEITLDYLDKNGKDGNYKEKILPFFIYSLGMFVEPAKNAKGVRKTPVTFKNAQSGLPADQIIPALEALIQNGSHLTTHQWIHEFLLIHPFEDGNGRVAWLLQNAFDQTLDYPNKLEKHNFQDK